MKKGGFFHDYVNVYQRVIYKNPNTICCNHELTDGLGILSQMGGPKVKDPKSSNLSLFDSKTKADKC